MNEVDKKEFFDNLYGTKWSQEEVLEIISDLAWTSEYDVDPKKHQQKVLRFLEKLNQAVKERVNGRIETKKTSDI